MIGASAARLLAEEKHDFPRVTAACPYFGRCGGCSLQDLTYHDQLALKQRRLHQALAAFDPALRPSIRPLDDPWRYRNKAELTFSQLDGELVLGYHAARSFWRVLDVEDCLLLPEPMVAVIRDARRLARESGAPAYNPRTHQGFFRHLTIRQSRATGQLLLCVTTTPGPGETLQRMTEALMSRHPRLVSVWWGQRASVADLAVPETLTLLRGAACLVDRMGRFRIDVGALTFLQPTPAQAEPLYDYLLDALPVARQGTAWDLYCGMGLVALYLAQRFERVYGIDAAEQNIELATRNAASNGVANVTFRLGTVEALLEDRRFWLQEAKPECVVVDPPRAGLHPRAVAGVLAARPRSLAYLSCSVPSLVRDLQALLGAYPRYRIERVEAFDMFPHTAHVEVCVVLARC